MQYDFGNIDATVRDGTWLANALNNWRDAIYSMQRGPVRPAFAVAGMMWINDSGGASNWIVTQYLGGAIDLPILALDSVAGTARLLIGVDVGANGALLRASNLSDLVDKPTSRNNLGLGTLAVKSQVNGADIALAGQVQGAMAWLNAGVWSPVPPGVAGQALISAGPGVVPGWGVNGGAPVATPTYDTVNTLLIDPVSFPGAGGDSIMQITQGTPVFSRSFTAVDATHPVEVDITLWPGGTGAPCWVAGALFIDGAPAAVAQGTGAVNTSWTNSPLRIYWQGVLAAGAHTFAVRFGGTAGGAVYLNGYNGNVRVGGGVQRSSMVIREIGRGPVGPVGPQGPPGGVANVTDGRSAAWQLLTGTIALGAAAPLPTAGVLAFTTTMTPARATSMLAIDFGIDWVAGAADIYTFLLVRDGVLVDTMWTHGTGASYVMKTQHKIVVPAVATVPTTFTVREGSQSANGMYVNGNSAGLVAGGTMKSGLIITEM